MRFEQAGYDVVFVNKFSKAFLEAYQYSRAKMGTAKPIYGYANVNVFLNEQKMCLSLIFPRSEKQSTL